MLRTRIDDDFEIDVMGACDDRVRDRLRQEPLGVVGDHDDVARSDGGVEQLENLRLDRGGRRLDVLVIESDDLLMLAHHTGLAKRRQPVIDGEQIDAGVPRTALQGSSPFVVADQRNQRGAAAQRHNVRGGVRGAAKHVSGRVDLQHRHWRFRRNPAAIADQVLIEDGVTDDQHAAMREVRNVIRQGICGLVKRHGNLWGAPVCAARVSLARRLGRQRSLRFAAGRRDPCNMLN